MRTPHFKIDGQLFRAALKYSLAALEQVRTKEEKRVVALDLVGALNSAAAAILTHAFHFEAIDDNSERKEEFDSIAHGIADCLDDAVINHLGSHGISIPEEAICKCEDEEDEGKKAYAESVKRTAESASRLSEEDRKEGRRLARAVAKSIALAWGMPEEEFEAAADKAERDLEEAEKARQETDAQKEFLDAAEAVSEEAATPSD